MTAESANEQEPAPSAVSKALQLLEVIGSADPPLRLSELARRVGLHRATAYRSLQELAARGFVEKDGADRYIVGRTFFSISASTGARHALRSRQQAPLRSLAEATERIASFQLLEGHMCTVVNAVRPPRYNRYLGFMDEPISPWRSAGGMVLLAQSSPETVREVLVEASDAGIDVEVLRNEIEAVGANHYAFYSARLDPFVAHIAIPVGSSQHRSAAAALSLSGFVEDFKQDDVPVLLTALRAAAATFRDFAA